jgi:cell division protein FtsB
MRQPVTVIIQPHAIEQARLYAAGRSDSEAVQHVLEDYPRLVGELRQLRRRVAQLDEEGTIIDARLEALQAACRSILDL